MLMLILLRLRKDISLVHFNTSHVNVNQLWILLYHTVYAISIHLMLMLIGFCNREEVHNRRISIHLMLMLIQEDAHEGKTAN